MVVIEAEADRGGQNTGRLTTGRRYLSQMPVSCTYSDFTAPGNPATSSAGARTEVSRGELILETHLGGCGDRIAAEKNTETLSAGWVVTRIC